jgi:Tol biopolymer transport system component
VIAPQRRRWSAGAIGGIALAAGCGHRPAPASAPPAEPDRIAIVASERGPNGARLVAIDEHGDRRFELVAPVTAGIVRDVNPAISPDGRWIVFASTRGRTLDRTSLWLARLGVETEPVRIAGGAWIDSHPAWTRDGRAIVFASTRDGGDFDLWRLPIAAGRAGGPPQQLTSAPAHEVTPAVGADGAIVYAAVTPKGGLEVESRLEERAADGTIRALTAGPADASPAISPDGAAIAFARPAVHDGVPHSELWRVARGGGEAAVLVGLPLTDESGPVWSPDGRFVFATSVLRGAGGRPLFSSVVHVDLQEVPAKVRILRDRAGAIARFTPAVVAAHLDAPALRGDPEYLPELARIMARAIADAAASP